MRLMPGNTPTCTRILAEQSSHYASLSVAGVYICVFHVRLSQRCDTATLSLRHLTELFIKLINDI